MTEMEGFVISARAAVLFLSLLQSITAQHPNIAVVGGVENVNNSTIHVDDNESLEMNCSTSSLPPDTRISSYRWVFTNAVVPGANAIVNSEMNSSLLRIRSLSYFHHLGNYTCIITTPSGQHLRSPVLTVGAKYVSANTDNTVLVVHNKPAILKCIVVLPTNVRNAHIRWFQGSLALTDKLPVENNTYYRIENATEENDGGYSCEVTSDSSGRAYGYFTLKVITKPRFTQNTEVTVNLEETSTIDCRVMSKSDVNFTWHFNGNITWQAEESPVTMGDDSIVTSTMSIEDITYAEAGNYTCMATNIAGTAADIITVTVQGRPVLSLTSDHSVITAPVHESPLTLDCPYISNPPANHMEWTRNQEPLMNGTRFMMFLNGSLQISHLTLSDSGNYSCGIHNNLGSDLATYTLQVIETPSQPTNLQSEILPSKNTDSVLLSWTTPQAEGGRPLDGYLMVVYLGTEILHQIELANNSTNKTLTELLPGQAYNVSLQGVNSAGLSLASYTLFDMPVAAPSLSFNVSALPDGRSLFVQWQLNHNGGAPIQSFTIQVYTIKQSRQLILSQQLSVSAGSHKMVDLEPAAEYHVSFNISNNVREASMDFTIATTMAPPSRPSTPEITLTTTDILEMKFTVEQGSYPITDFLLNTTRVLSDGGSSTTQKLVAMDDPHVEAVEEVGEGEWEVVMVLAELQQLQLYTFQVAALSEVGQGEFSQPSSPTSLDDGRVLYYIVFGVVGGAVLIGTVIIIVSVVMLLTTRRIQKNKRTLSINGSGSQKGLPQSFISPDTPPPLPLSPTSMDRRSSRPSLQLHVNDYCSSYRGDTPLSSASDYKHHMLSSSVNEASTPIYDRLDSVFSEEKESGVGLSASDGARQIPAKIANGRLSASDGARQIPAKIADGRLSAGNGAQQIQKERITINLCASEDSVVTDSMPASSCLLSTRARANSAVGPSHSKSSNSLFVHQQQLQQQPQQPQWHQQQQLLPVGHSRQQHLPTSLNQLHVVSAPAYNHHFLCPPQSIAGGSTPAINCRGSCDSMLENYRPTDYMTDV